MEEKYRGVKIRYEMSVEGDKMVFRAVVDGAHLICNNKQTIIAMIDGILDSEPEEAR